MFIKNRPNVLQKYHGADWKFRLVQSYTIVKKTPRNVYLKVGHYSTILVKVMLFFIAIHTVTSCVIKRLKNYV